MYNYGKHACCILCGRNHAEEGAALRHVERVSVQDLGAEMRMLEDMALKAIQYAQSRGVSHIQEPLL